MLIKALYGAGLVADNCDSRRQPTLGYENYIDFCQPEHQANGWVRSVRTGFWNADCDHLLTTVLLVSFVKSRIDFR